MSKRINISCQSILSFLFNFLSNCLFWCLQWLINSLLSFNNHTSSKYSINRNFSARRNGQQSIFLFPWTFSTLDHSILYGICYGIIMTIYISTTQHFCCVACGWNFFMISKPLFKSCCRKSEIHVCFKLDSFSLMLYILNLEFATNFEEDRYFLLYSCIHIW